MSVQKIIIFTSLIGLTVLFSSISYSHGHGLGFEVLPPVQLGDKQVALEITSSQYSDPQSTDRQVTFTLFDTSTGISVRDITYHITAKKGSVFLFDETFKSNNGILTMNFIHTESEKIMIEEEKQGVFDSILGLQKDVVTIKGSPFSTGGLYSFQVEILTAESYSKVLDVPIEYEVGLSIPDRTFYEINDINFGEQQISVITYYDQIQDFHYDEQTKSITFRMPFDWSLNNINQTSVVHQELIIPKTFGDLMVSSFLAYVNDIEVSAYTITIDDFSEKTRILHLVLNQNELFSLAKKQDLKNEMRFLIKPSEANLPLATVTGNGQFRISLTWEPPEIKSGEKTTFFFDITDVFLKNRPISVTYDLSIIHQGKEISRYGGTSTGSKDESNVIEFLIPENVSGPITLQFENLDGNSLARVGIPVVVNRIYELSENVETEISIPDWVRNNAGWWSEGQIADNDFASGIEFLMKQKIIKVPVTSDGEVFKEAVIPDWVRNNAGWWSEGLISDKEFANGLQFLIINGIISV